MSNSNLVLINQYKAPQDNWNDRVWNVVHDIQDSPKISLLSLLTALLTRLLLDVSNDDVETSQRSLTEKVKQSKYIIELMYQDATAFCDDEGNIGTTKTKKHLRD